MKRCVPNADVTRQIVALSAYLAAAEPPATLRILAWDDGVQAGVAAHLSAPRKDLLIRRGGWQFGDRTEHLALLAEDD